MPLQVLLWSVCDAWKEEYGTVTSLQLRWVMSAVGNTFDRAMCCLSLQSSFILFGGHIQRCSGVIPGAADLKESLLAMLEGHMRRWGWNLG